MKQRPELVITRGPSGSGKTTWAKGWVAAEPNFRTRVNRDDLRRMLYGRGFPLSDVTEIAYGMENAVTSAQQEAVRGLLEARRSVVVDDTHISSRYVRAWREIAEDAGADFSVNDDFCAVPEAQCLVWNVLRSKDARVPEEVIHTQIERLQNALRNEDRNQVFEPDGGWHYEPDPSLPSAFLLDLDGTIAKHVGRSPYDYSLVGTDELIEPVLHLARQLVTAGWNCICLSGRPDSCSGDTMKWLGKHAVPLTELHMRETGDDRKDEVIKLEIFRREIAPRWSIRLAIDDRNRVVRMWRRIGLLCAQVAPGAF